MPGEYDEKRKFDATPEPKMVRKESGEGPLTFVIQKHAATSLHYDFRIELDGVMKSWAIPKGPSLDPADKRLAMMVEDHPLDYSSFEGVIPEGNYGAGEVIVWDNGFFSPDEDERLLFYDREEAQKELRKCLENGKVSVFLHGVKLHGSFALVKMKGEGKKNEWLFFKHNDAFAKPGKDILAQGASVISGLTIEDLKNGEEPGRVRHISAAVEPADIPGARRSAFPKKITPMAAATADAPFSHPDWIFEPKMDGIRAIVFKDGTKVRLVTRNHNDVSRQYPGIAKLFAEQNCDEMVVDGEIVAFDDRSVPSFHQLQQRMNLTGDADIASAEVRIPAYFFAFDLLYMDGSDLTGCAVVDRKAMLRRAILPSARLCILDDFPEAGEAAYRALTARGFEGVVAKRRNSKYEAGKRSPNWLKIKSTLSEEFLIGGYSVGLGSRSSTFGALLLGTREEDGSLRYVGNVGSGFSDKTLEQYLPELERLKTKKTPFSAVPPLKTPATWLEPKLVAEVKFNQWTPDGHLRAPVFLRMRQDLDPEELLPAEVVEVEKSPEQAADVVADLVKQIDSGKRDFSLHCEGHEIGVSNPDKILWPAGDGQKGYSKRDLLRYFAQVSPYLLPHLVDRPLTLSRYPNGIDGGMFFQKHWEHKLPDFVTIVRLYSEHANEDQEYIACDNLPTLLWLGQLTDLELHPWTSRTNTEPDAHDLPTIFDGSAENIDESVLNYPDYLLFDIDPYIYSGKEKEGAEPEFNKEAFEKGRETAFWVKELLDSLKLASFVKTSGKTGLHIYVPILRHFTYDQVRPAAATLCNFILRAHPKEITTDWAVKKRTGKIFMDYNQNSRGKTLSSIYSPRALPHAPVSMPVSWEELKKITPTDFTLTTVPEILKKHGDPWAKILEAKNDLKGMLG
jgi:bifunctional non-homologous end joining protein LigD